MTEFAGYDASVSWAGGHANAVVNAHEWSLTVEADELDKTTFASTGWRSYRGGLKNWSGSMTVHLDDTAALPAPGAAATSLELVVATGFGFKGNAFCLSINPSAPVGGLGACTVNFRGTDDLTIGAI